MCADDNVKFEVNVIFFANICLETAEFCKMRKNALDFRACSLNMPKLADLGCGFA